MSGVNVTQADRDFHAQINRLVEPKCGFVPLKETAELVARHREASVAAAVAERDAKIAGLVEALREIACPEADPDFLSHSQRVARAALQEHGRG